MSPAVTQSLPSAVAVVLSAAPILAVVLVLVTTRPWRVSAMFLVGWAAAILTVAGLIVAFVDKSVRRGLPPTAGAIARISLGAVLAALAVRSWRRRAEAHPEPRKLISRIANWRWPRALAVGFALGSVNPKNLVLVSAGATAILGATSLAHEQALAVVVFAAVASVGIAIPIVLRGVGGPKVNAGLERAAEWMTRHGKILSAVVLAVLAVVLITKGVAGLRS